MAFRPAPQGNPHGLSRVRAVGSPFEVSNNSSRVPQTLNYVDCYPMKEEQFGENPLYAVTCREAFKSLGSYDLSTINLSTGFNGGAIPNNGVSPPATLAGYLVAQVGQLLLVDDASTNVGGTVLFCNVMLYNASLAGTTNAYAVVSLQITVAGVSGTTVTPQPTYIFFDSGPTIGAAAIANNSITGVNAAFIDPYYLIYSAPTPLALTASAGNTANYNIYTQAVAAGMTTARSITLTIPNTATIGTLLTGSGFAAGTTITIVNNGTILGNGGAGGTGATVYGATPSSGSPGTPAIIMNWPITLINTGTIAGGGGGGAGGAAGSGNRNYFGGNGGGGGQGYTGGSGGAGGVASGSTGSPGIAGTSAGGGQGALTTGTYQGGAGGVGYLNAGLPGYGTYGAPFVVSGCGGGGGGYAAAGGGTGVYGGASAPVKTPLLVSGAAAGNAIQCNGYSVLNVPNGTYTGAGAYGTIYGVIG
jgi:hypothetical protein